MKGKSTERYRLIRRGGFALHASARDFFLEGEAPAEPGVEDTTLAGVFSEKEKIRRTLPAP